ncbi:MAG: DUF2274 domain-containing protein [Acidimicrobiia bacterium]|nr:DUF2274 domain-containing protein [Acidimicrobiia bacterium]
MKLKPAPKPATPRELKLRLEADTYGELEAYAELYEAEYGDAIDVPKLAAEILRQFLETDRAFRSWKRRQRREGARARRANGPEPGAAAEEARA